VRESGRDAHLLSSSTICSPHKIEDGSPAAILAMYGWTTSYVTTGTWLLKAEMSVDPFMNLFKYSVT